MLNRRVTRFALLMALACLSVTVQAQVGWSGKVARRQSDMVYDAAGARLLLFGGESAGITLGDMWQKGISSWQEVALTSGPSLRGHVMGYLPAQLPARPIPQVIAFGGFSPTGTASGATWV
ncbi:hypothetical protein, partial [Bradyrhizobium sp. NBAIM08]|uniref:hypothetical protein n=1 Tax=Bradyrhizobium sp. NBAIM08 TaxID=2793815 RepID=UPI001CD28B30